MSTLDELPKLEYQALRTELINWQTLRFTLLGIAAAVDAALISWIATSGSKLSMGEAAVPLFLVLGLAALITGQVARLILRISTYSEMVYRSPWERRLELFRERVRPWRVNTWIAATYLFLAAASLALAASTCERKTTLDLQVMACFLGLVALAPVLDLLTVSRMTQNYRDNWKAVVAGEA